MNKQPQKRFGQELQEEANKPEPSSEGVLSLQERLTRFTNNIRRKYGWHPPDENLIPLSDFKSAQKDAINDTIVELLNLYRQKLTISRVTSKATNAVLKQVRNWVRRQYAELSRTESVSNADVEAFSPAVFRPSAEDKVEDFERLYALGVIDIVEYYFLFAAYHGYKNAEAAKLISLKEIGTGRKILERARDRVQAYLEQMDGGDLPSPKLAQDNQGTRVPREIDMDLLMGAIREILGKSF